MKTVADPRGNPLVSVVIPTFNARRTIHRAISSVQNQTYKNLEIIIVDDGSTDGTIESLGQLGSDIICVSQTNSGPAKARNTGIAHSQGEYIAFLDSDDQWKKGKISLQVNYLENHEEFGLVFTNATWNTTTKTVESHFDMMGANLPESSVFEYGFNDLFNKNIIPTSTVLVRKEELQRTRGFDEGLKVAEDFDLWLRMVVATRFAGFRDVLVDRFHTSQNLSEDTLALCNGVIEVIDKLQKCNRHIFTKYGVDIRGKLSDLYYICGYHMLEMAEPDKARDYFRESLGQKWSLRIFRGFILTLLTKPQIDMLRRFTAFIK